jgi:hypothetical protein
MGRRQRRNVCETLALLGLRQDRGERLLQGSGGARLKWSYDDIFPSRVRS